MLIVVAVAMLRAVMLMLVAGNPFADRGRAQDDVGLMGETDLRSSGEKGTVN